LALRNKIPNDSGESVTTIKCVAGVYGDCGNGKPCGDLHPY
jgi:hypothetical protein